MNTSLTAPPVIQLGDPRLRLKSEAIHDNEFDTPELKEIIEFLFAAKKEKGGVGVAAPQLGINKRLFVLGMDSHPIYTHASPIPNRVFINPIFELLGETTEEAYEGCLSVGTLRGKVSRHTHLRFTAFNLEGQSFSETVSGLYARAIQHETDHLDGVLFLDRVTDHHSIGFLPELIAAGAVKMKASN
jgi:peptide deformylase